MLRLFSDEVERRHGAAATRRADAAGLDPDMVFERRDKTAKVTFDRRVLQELATLRFLEAQRNVVVLGPVGVGKTKDGPPPSAPVIKPQVPPEGVDGPGDPPSSGLLPEASGLDVCRPVWHQANRSSDFPLGSIILAIGGSMGVAGGRQ